MAATTRKSLRGRKQRRWIEAEIYMLLNYLRDTINEGRTIEKPTAVQYYQKMIEKQKLVGLTPLLLKNKARYLLSSYKDALKWKAEAGHEVKEEKGEEHFEETFKRKYPYFKESHEIWGSKLNIHSSYSLSNGDQVNGQHIAFDFAEDLQVVSENISNDGQVTTEDATPDKEEEACLVLHASDAENLDTYSDTAQGLSASINLLGIPPSSPAKQNRCTTCHREFYDETTKQRKLDEERLAVMKTKVALQREKISLEHRRLELEMQYKTDELKVRQCESENHKEIRLQEIKLKKLKWEVELLKLRKPP